MKRIICFFKGHTRGDTEWFPWDKTWNIQCKRCGYKVKYTSPCARLVGEEIRLKFDGF